MTASVPELTAAQRRELPNLAGIAEAVAEKWGVCQRPVPMFAFRPIAGETKYIGAACKTTRAADCPACAKKAHALRFTQCSEGWHLPEEPVRYRKPPSESQKALYEARADMLAEYQAARDRGDEQAAEGFRAVIEDLDRELKESGMSGRIKGIDATVRPRKKRSTKRRDDVPDLPRKKIEKTTLGRTFAGKHQPSMFLTVTMDSYGRCHRDGAIGKDGKVCGDGSPVDPETYDYRRAARDAMFFPKLFDRTIQNWRRAAGRDIQYFATVEPQRRGAPHAHMAIRGTDPHALVSQIIAASYASVWWPHFDQELYTDDRMPVWDQAAGTFTDPDTGNLLPGFDDVMSLMDEMDDVAPAHVVRWGVQVDQADIGETDPDGEAGPVRPGKAKGVIAKDANRLIGYLTKYLTKSISEVLEPPNDRVRRHYERLHEEMQRIPCSEKCGVWLRYGIVPRGATVKTQPGRCKGKAHQRANLGLRGRRVLVSRYWSNKTLPDHKADRIEFVRQLLARVGLAKNEEAEAWTVRPVEPGDVGVPPREHFIMASVAEQSRRRSELLTAQLALADSPGPQRVSETQAAA